MSVSKALRRRRGFTLLELLIAIAAVALISLGIFQVFRATGETLRTGRRVSAFNAQASLLERQLRDDVSRMTRDGFLAIRNELVNPNPPGVSLFPGQPSNFDPRRADEIVFFARGPFTTRRDPVHPSRIARSSEARIWIGHGLTQNPADANFYAPIKLNDDNTVAPELGTLSNQFASQWTVLRHVLLLCKPREGLIDPLSPVPPPTGEPGTDEQADNDIQVDLQPAASSIFRVLTRTNPPLTVMGGPVGNVDLVRDESPVENPDPAGGVVDIATTNLSEIQAIVLDAQDPATLILTPSSPFAVSTPPAFAVDTAPATSGSVTDIMQQWMIEAFPAESDEHVRMRYERSPTDLTGAIGGGGSPFNKDYKRSDQLMLSSSTLAIGCSEMIIEWSFGKRIAIGQPGEGLLIWHGMEREADVDGDGVLDTVANLYEASTGPTGDAVQQVYRRLDGTREVRPGFIDPNIIHDQGTITGGAADPAYSFFGYVDPTYAPPPPPNLNGEPASMPWPWPKLIRFTVRLVDQSDPSFEQTYQFIFELPGDNDTMRQ